MGHKILVHIWEPQADKLVFTLEINLYHMKRGVKTGPDIKQVEMMDQQYFAKRKAPSMLPSFYSP